VSKYDRVVVRCTASTCRESRSIAAHRYHHALPIRTFVSEVHRYAKMLVVIKEEVERPENRVKAERGEDVLIPRERFESVLKAWKPEPEAHARPMLWYFLLVWLVAALIIGFAILR